MIHIIHMPKGGHMMKYNGELPSLGKLVIFDNILARLVAI